MATPFDSESFEALMVILGEARIALPSTGIVEVARMVATTPLPGAPPIVEGTIGHRGAIVPVLDIRKRLGLPPRGVDLSAHLVVLRAGGRTVALRVDRAIGLVSIERASLVPAVQLARGTERLAGAWQAPDGTVAIVDPERFLDEAEERSLAEALAAAPPGER